MKISCISSYQTWWIKMKKKSKARGQPIWNVRAAAQEGELSKPIIEFKWWHLSGKPKPLNSLTFLALFALASYLNGIIIRIFRCHSLHLYSDFSLDFFFFFETLKKITLVITKERHQGFVEVKDGKKKKFYTSACIPEKERQRERRNCETHSSRHASLERTRPRRFLGWLIFLKIPSTLQRGMSARNHIFSLSLPLLAPALASLDSLLTIKAHHPLLSDPAH